MSDLLLAPAWDEALVSDLRGFTFSLSELENDALFFHVLPDRPMPSPSRAAKALGFKWTEKFEGGEVGQGMRIAWLSPAGAKAARARLDVALREPDALAAKLCETMEALDTEEDVEAIAEALRAVQLNSTAREPAERVGQAFVAYVLALRAASDEGTGIAVIRVAG
jgi:hypothetical protein